MAKESAREPHEVLGISENASVVEIEGAFNRKKLYLNPANFDEGSKEQEETKNHLAELGEARIKMLAAAGRQQDQPSPPREEEGPKAEPFAEPDFPILNPASETRKRMFLSIAGTIVLAFLVMLFVSLSFAYTSGLKTDIAELNTRIRLLETEKDNLKDKADSLDGKINDLINSIDNLNNNVLDLNSQVTALEYQR